MLLNMEENFSLDVWAVSETARKNIGEALRKHILGFSGEQSQSLQKERVESLIQSWQYVIKLYLEYGEVEKSQSEIIENLNAFFEEACAFIQIFVHETKQLFNQLEKQRVPIDNIFYKDTFECAVPQFFELYNWRYGAHETVTDMDYPLSQDIMNECGILYIRKFLEISILENQFLKMFDANESLLYFKKYSICQKSCLKDCFTNFFMVAAEGYFIKFVHKTMMDSRGEKGVFQSTPTILLTSTEKKRLVQFLYGLSETQCQNYLETCLENFVQMLSKRHSANMERLAKQVLLDRLPALLSAIKTGQLEPLIFDLNESVHA